MVSRRFAPINGTVSGSFTNPIGGTYTTSTNKDTFTWGIATTDGSPSSLSFTGDSFEAFPIPGEVDNALTFPTGYTYGERQDNLYRYFSLGTLSYRNGEIKSGTGSSSVQLDITIQITDPVATEPATFNYRLDLINTPNGDDPEASSDSVIFEKIIPSDNSSPVTLLETSDGLPLSLSVEGFGNIVGNGFSEEREFFVEEMQTAEAELIGRFVDPIEEIISPGIDSNNAEPIKVFPEPGVNSITMEATFTPNFGLTLDEAAKLLDLTISIGIKWLLKIQQIKTEKDGSEGKIVTNYRGEQLLAPYIDPPERGYRGGDYTDNKGRVKEPGYLDDNYPFYLDEDNPTERSNWQKHVSNEGKTLRIKDIPEDPYYDKHPKEYTEFQTSLVGVFSDKTWQVLYTFNWKSNYVRTGKGGVIITGQSNASQQSSSGSGGVFDLRLNLNPADVSASVRRLMEADGAINASGAAGTPLAPIDFSKRKLGRKLNGTNRSDKLDGTNKNDLIKGKNRRDREFGNSGNDQLQGGKGNDWLNGGNGNDVLIGDLGNDILIGGKGSDTFTFTKVNDGVDTIKDFTIGTDLIDLRKIFATSAYIGVDTFSRFTEFLQIVSVGADSQVRIDADGAGAGTNFVALATLRGVIASNITTRSFVIG